MSLFKKKYTIATGLYASLPEGRRDYVEFDSYRTTSKYGGLRQRVFTGIPAWIDILAILPSVSQFLLQAQANFDRNGDIWPCPIFQVWPTRGHLAFFLDTYIKKDKLFLSVWLEGYASSPVRNPTHYLRRGNDKIQFLSSEIDGLIMACAKLFDDLKAEQAVEHAHCATTVPMQFPLCNKCYDPAETTVPDENPLKDLRQGLIEQYRVRSHPFH